GALIGETLDRLAAAGRLESVPQAADGGTYAPLLTREHGRADWAQDAAGIDRQVMSLNPWPGVRTLAGDRRLKILEAVPESGAAAGGAPGTLADRQGRVACGRGTVLRLLRVQPENAKAMDAASAVNGGYLAPGVVFS